MKPLITFTSSSKAAVDDSIRCSEELMRSQQPVSIDKTGHSLADRGQQQVHDSVMVNQLGIIEPCTEKSIRYW